MSSLRIAPSVTRFARATFPASRGKELEPIIQSFNSFPVYGGSSEAEVRLPRGRGARGFGEGVTEVGSLSRPRLFRALIPD